MVKIASTHRESGLQLARVVATIADMTLEGAAKTPGLLAPHPALSAYYRGSKRPFVRQIFDKGAADYDRVERMMALGSGSWYRRQALLRAGLLTGMRVLDVAVGTGLVAREEVGIVGSPRLVIGLDPSSGMLAQVIRSLDIRVVMGIGEQLPVRDSLFDFVSMGYALRHVSDLNAAFCEFFRVLKPGGKICVLELIRPTGKIRAALLRWYMRRLVPGLTRLVTGHGNSRLLWEYYWETIESCIPAQRVLEALRNTGFTDVRQHTELGIFAEYTANKPSEAIA